MTSTTTVAAFQFTNHHHFLNPETLKVTMQPETVPACLVTTHHLHTRRQAKTLPRLHHRFVQTQKLNRRNAQLTAPRAIAK